MAVDAAAALLSEARSIKEPRDLRMMASTRCRNDADF